MREVGVAILGGSGYGAGEMLRLLVQHPSVEVVSVVSSSATGQRIGEVHPHLNGFYDGVLVGQVGWDALVAHPKRVIVSAQPNGVSGSSLERLAPLCQQHGIKVIDLSGDLRLREPRTHARYYPESAEAETLRREVVYGLPELDRDAIRDAWLVANPGCLASACILAAAPFAGAVTGTIVFDAKTGSSGAGSTPRPTTHHPVRHSNFFAYKPLSHQHEPEIVQALQSITGSALDCVFVPQSMAVSRGIYVTTYMRLTDARSTESVQQDLRNFYRGAPFVRVCGGPPELQNVVGSNFCDIGVAVRDRDLVVMSALDNLIKGMCGTAIQNLNLMCGLDETEGLWLPGMRPV